MPALPLCSRCTRHPCTNTIVCEERSLTSGASSSQRPLHGFPARLDGFRPCPPSAPPSRRFWLPGVSTGMRSQHCGLPASWADRWPSVFLGPLALFGLEGTCHALARGLGSASLERCTELAAQRGRADSNALVASAHSLEPVVATVTIAAVGGHSRRSRPSWGFLSHDAV